MELIRCVFIILRIFLPLPAAAWAAVPQAHAWRTVRQLGKKHIYVEIRKLPIFVRGWWGSLAKNLSLLSPLDSVVHFHSILLSNILDMLSPDFLDILYIQEFLTWFCCNDDVLLV